MLMTAVEQGIQPSKLCTASGIDPCHPRSASIAIDTRARLTFPERALQVADVAGKKLAHQLWPARADARNYRIPEAQLPLLCPP